jgi:hypothetical protein
MGEAAVTTASSTYQDLPMDFDKFDSDTDASDENYLAFVDWLSELTANELRQAKGSPEQQKLALCRYYKRGERANLTTDE